MTQPKLREGAEKLILARINEITADAKEALIYTEGAFWALNNLHKLLEPRDQPRVNGKRVAIVEVEE
jgi:hypothetical protein